MYNLSLPPFYENGENTFYKDSTLKKGVGNNAFSCDKKPERNGLRITPLKVSSMDSLCVGEHIAFQDFDGDQWMECKGLESAILCLDYDVPVYVFDNHNQVFYAWCEALYMNWIQPAATLVHVDAHYDDAEAPHRKVDIHDLQQVFEYTQNTLQIATFIKPALKLGLFKEVLNFVESHEFDAQWPNASGDVVLNLDLDVFCEEMSHVTFSKKLEVLKHYLPQTTLITMSTSPFFIDQPKAIQMAQRVVQELFSQS